MRSCASQAPARRRPVRCRTLGWRENCGGPKWLPHGGKVLSCYPFVWGGMFFLSEHQVINLESLEFVPIFLKTDFYTPLSDEISPEILQKQ